MTQQRASLAQQHIRINKPSPLRVVIPALQVIQSGVEVEYISSVSERIMHAQRACHAAGFCQRCSPCIVLVFYHCPFPVSRPPPSPTRNIKKGVSLSTNTFIGIRRRPTLPGRFQPSTISAERLNFCVRYGNRWIPLAITTGNCISINRV